MWNFLRKLFSRNRSNITVIVLDGDDSGDSGSMKLQANDVVKLGLYVVLASAVVTVVLLLATPLGAVLQYWQDRGVRQEVAAINERVLALQDTLYARDTQLQDMKEVLRVGPDTLFPVEFPTDRMEYGEEEHTFRRLTDAPPENSFDMLSQSEVLFFGSFGGAPDFPANYPLQGTLTQPFSAELGHYGIDIAATAGTEFRALADGTVLNAGWTIHYGYVIYVQHADGFVSVYKHGSKLFKEQGDFVLKGDILGTIGDRGVLSTGSHLHLEIWKNGVPQNPAMFLMD